MEKYTVQDFLDAQLRITEIIRIYSAESNTWRRDTYLPRKDEGLLMFTSGCIRYDFGEFTFTASAGQVLRLPAGIPYRGDMLSREPLRFVCIDFLTAESGEYLRYPLPKSFTPSDPDAAVSMFANLEHTWTQKALCRQSDCMSQLHRLIATLTKDIAVNRCGFDDTNRALQISEYIRENAHLPQLRVTDIAAHFHMSPTHLRRIFAAQLGTSPAAALNAVRLENAKRLLLSQRSLTISEIAQMCGYGSVYYFSQCFRDATGTSPSRWREMRTQA